MMIFSLVAMIGLEKCCIISACLQWLCHSGERTVARGPLVSFMLIPLGANYFPFMLVPFEKGFVYEESYFLYRFEDFKSAFM